uniref:non-specific serine/threonine protein kinase n=1 Tax=Oryza meridionalis TaxID=40149 RepID=A0A0E0DMM0_9ORYZ
MTPLINISLGLILVFLHSTTTSCAANDVLRVAQALTVGDKLVSRNGKFTLGFFQPSIVSKSGNIISPNWYVAITMNNTTSAVLSNDGNLVIGSSSNMLWQSFDNPSDVLLPGAKFGWNKLTGFTRQIISKKNLIDPGLGLYHVELGSKGVSLRRRNPSVVYWSWSSKKSTDKFMLISLLKQLININPHTRGRIDIKHVDNNQEEYYTYILLDESYSIYVLLDISGQVEINIWSQLTQSLQKVYAQPADPCTAFGTCGPFTICNGVSRPFCDCMESFSRKSPQDWELDDRTAGCMRNT